MIAESPKAFLFLGDTVYADTEDMTVKRAAYNRLAGHPGFRRMKATGPIWAIWDDHDYGYNDSGTAYKPKAVSQQVFLDAFEEPVGSARRKQNGIYFSEEIMWKKIRIQFIFPDLRYFRSEWKKGPPTELYSETHAIDDSQAATMLGDVQWAWLRNTLERPADLRILISSTAVLTDDFPGERWGAFPREREKLFKFLRNSKGSWIILSGDRHFAQVSRRTDILPYPLYELTSSGLNSSWADGIRDKDRYRVGQVMAEDNYGVLEIDATRKQIRYFLKNPQGMAKIAGAIPFEEINLRVADNTGN